MRSHCRESLSSSGQGAAPGTGAPSWQPLLADLSGAQASVRLDALYALAQTGDAAVVPYVIPMLEDVDLFVRMAAARVLENMKPRAPSPR
jgi:HEAT repeat protein